MTVTVPGYSSLTGSPEAILKLMEDARFMNQQTGDDYIRSVVETIWRTFGIGLQVTGETYAERAASLLDEMAKHGLITISK